MGKVISAHRFAEASIGFGIGTLASFWLGVVDPWHSTQWLLFSILLGVQAIYRQNKEA